MKILITLIALFVGSMALAQNHDGHNGTHTPNVCTNNSAVCAHLMFPKTPNSTDESQFILHFVTNQAITNLKVALWMPDMGHGSSPVTIKSIDNNHYQVSNAYFIMSGDWEVRVQFTSDDQNQSIHIPVQILN